MQNVYEKNTIDDDVILRAKEGDLEAREFLLVAFTPLIISLVKKYNIPGYTFDDLVQHCNLTLLHALSLFKFSGFFP
ncbi:MAG: helix-turn-helix domain-containing protein, partial [Clostridium sp.]